MSVTKNIPEWKYPRHEGVTLVEKQKAMLAALGTLEALRVRRYKSSKPTEEEIRKIDGELLKIAREYMFEEAGMVRPVWQALALNSNTPRKVIRDLEQKQEWSLDILLVQHPHASEAFLHRMKNLREDIQGKNSSSKGFDNNKELRVYARKRLGLPLEDDRDDD